MDYINESIICLKQSRRLAFVELYSGSVSTCHGKRPRKTKTNILPAQNDDDNSFEKGIQDSAIKFREHVGHVKGNVLAKL